MDKIINLIFSAVLVLIEENKEKDLAIVAIMNKEVPYGKECIDYHIFVEVAYQPLVCTFYKFV